jgi:hypothetical protein
MCYEGEGGEGGGGEENAKGYQNKETPKQGTKKNIRGGGGENWKYKMKNQYQSTSKRGIGPQKQPRRAKATGRLLEETRSSY